MEDILTWTRTEDPVSVLQNTTDIRRIPTTSNPGTLHGSNTNSRIDSSITEATVKDVVESTRRTAATDGRITPCRSMVKNLRLTSHLQFFIQRRQEHPCVQSPRGFCHDKRGMSADSPVPVQLEKGSIRWLWADQHHMPDNHYISQRQTTSWKSCVRLLELLEINGAILHPLETSPPPIWGTFYTQVTWLWGLCVIHGPSYSAIHSWKVIGRQLSSIYSISHTLRWLNIKIIKVTIWSGGNAGSKIISQWSPSLRIRDLELVLNVEY